MEIGWRDAAAYANVRGVDPTAGPEEALLVWAYSAREAAQRLFHLGLKAHSYRAKAEAGVLILTLRNLLRSAEWLNNESSSGNTYGPALDQFHRKLPHLVAARNVLEHFDEYAVGNGRAQRRSVYHGGNAPSYPVTFSLGTNGVLAVRIGSLSVNVQNAYDACNGLLAFVYTRFLINDTAHIEIPHPEHSWLR